MSFFFLLQIYSTCGCLKVQGWCGTHAFWHPDYYKMPVVQIQRLLVIMHEKSWNYCIDDVVSLCSNIFTFPLTGKLVAIAVIDEKVSAEESLRYQLLSQLSFLLELIFTQKAHTEI